MRALTWRGALGAAVLALLAHGAGAQSYPQRSITVVVPFPAGSTTDIAGRIAGNELTRLLGQQIVIDNRGGAGGMVGAEYVSRATPDGYTLLLGTISSQSIVPHMYSKVPYDPIADFTPISRFGAIPNVLVVHPSLPINSLRELIAYAAAHPGKLNYGSSGGGTTAHLSGALLGVRTETNVVHVAYRGGAQAITDLLRGDVSFMFYQYITLLPHIADNKLRPLAVTGPARLPALPQLPTMAEAGVPDFEVTAWLAFYGPARLPPDIVAKLNTAVRGVMAAASVRDLLVAQGIEPVTSSPDELLAFNKSELTRWAKVVAESGAKID
ncbi:MAG: tripartite tricarboxylate transporter substrate binding protein [Proteobacteria bacterium]|nr:tripartite tricarboxylate transporter substrate binding protein [Pseudomonadota bacterium]